MEDYIKMSEQASFGLNNSHTVKILICYLLYKLNRPVTPQQLYEVAVDSEIINYFFYQEAIDDLIKNETIIVESDKMLNEVYVLTSKGISCAKNFRDYVPKYFREKLLRSALRFFARLKLENEVKIDYIKLDNGYHVHIRCLDLGDDLLEIKIFAPDLEQAKLLGEKIMVNPVGFYGNIINYALSNKEEEIVLEDNI